jgi:RHS repeat-associated protein
MFTGRRYDFEEASGLYYYRLRYYDPQAGRFVSRDPLGLWGDTSQNGNGQNYCANNPVNRVDPMGLDAGLGAAIAAFVEEAAVVGAATTTLAASVAAATVAAGAWSVLKMLESIADLDAQNRALEEAYLRELEMARRLADARRAAEEAARAEKAGAEEEARRRAQEEAQRALESADPTRTRTRTPDPGGTGGQPPTVPPAPPATPNPDDFDPVFGKNFEKKVREHIDQVRRRNGGREDIPRPSKGGAEAVERIIRERVARGNGRAGTYAREQAIFFEDCGVSYVFRTNGEFWTILSNMR